MNLNQQLEDKKKELITLKQGCYNYDGCDEMDLRCFEDNLCIDCGNKVIVCQAEIAILEQAIAEINKRDKIWEEEFLRAINLLPMEDNHNFNRNTITGFLKNAIAEIKNIQSQQNPNQTSEGVKIEASHNQHRTPKVVNVEEVRKDIKLTSTSLSADTQIQDEINKDYEEQ